MATTTIKLPVPEHFFAVRFPNLCVFCGEASETALDDSVWRSPAKDEKPELRAEIKLALPYCL